AAEDPGLPVDAPERAHIPDQALAHRLQYLRSGLLQRGRRRQNLGHRVLGQEPLLGELAFGDVLDRSEQAAWLARLVPEHVALTADEAAFAARPDHTVLAVVPQSASQRLGDLLFPSLTDGRVDPLQDFAQAYGARLWREPQDPPGLVRPRGAIGDGVTLPVPDVRDPLRLFETALALAQPAEHRQARQGIRESPADRLEEDLLAPRPDARVRALAEPKHVREIAFGVQRHGDPGLDAPALRLIGRQRMLRFRVEADGPARRPHDPVLGDAVRVPRQILAHAEAARKLGSRTVHRVPDGGSLGIAWIYEPGAIALEDRERRVENVAHHLLEIIRALDCAVHAIHALDRPPTLLALLLRFLVLGDVLGGDQDNGLTARPAHRLARLAHPQHRPALAHLAEVPTERAAELLQAEGDLRLNRWAIGFVEDLQYRLADQLVDGVAELLGAAGIDGHDGAGGIHHE